MKFLPRISVELARKRVAERVGKGGHDIPAEVIGRRFKRGVHNLFNLYRGLCDTIMIYDNSTVCPRLVATISGARTTVVEPNLFQRILSAECEGL